MNFCHDYHVLNRSRIICQSLKILVMVIYVYSFLYLSVHVRLKNWIRLWGSKRNVVRPLLCFFFFLVVHNWMLLLLAWNILVIAGALLRWKCMVHKLVFETENFIEFCIEYGMWNSCTCVMIHQSGQRSHGELVIKEYTKPKQNNVSKKRKEKTCKTFHTVAVIPSFSGTVCLSQPIC